MCLINNGCNKPVILPANGIPFKYRKSSPYSTPAKTELWCQNAYHICIRRNEPDLNSYRIRRNEPDLSQQIGTSWRIKGLYCGLKTSGNIFWWLLKQRGATFDSTNLFQMSEYFPFYSNLTANNVTWNFYSHRLC